MADDETTFIFVAVYGDEDDAQADYDVVKELYHAKAIGNFDAAVIRKAADGKVHVNKDETATRKGAWGGAAVGAVVGRGGSAGGGRLAAGQGHRQGLLARHQEDGPRGEEPAARRAGGRLRRHDVRRARVGDARPHARYGAGMGVFA